MKVSAFIRKTSNKNINSQRVTIYFRVRDNSVDIKSSSELSIHPNYWSSEKQGYKDRISLVHDDEKTRLSEQIQDIKKLIRENYHPDVDSKWLSEIINQYHNPKKQAEKLHAGLGEKCKEPNDFFQIFNQFLETHKLSEVRKKNFKVIYRSLQRYEKFNEIILNKKSFKLEFDKITKSTLQDIWNYLENEHIYYEKYPELFSIIKEKRKQQKRGKNTLIDYFGKLRTFLLWCHNKYTTNRPFDNFKLDEPNYGTPVYLTLEERDILFEKDFSNNPDLEKQRDIFIFQSVIGCRISDLYSFTKKSIINGAVEYIQRKTIEGRPVTVRVPLNDKARFILEKYKNYDGEGLLPFIAEQDYNESIKKALLHADITRIVTVIDPTTNSEVKRPIFEIASSHMARRTFIGNLYKKVKDPNLISALSGHKQGSKAFARYREIDDEIKKELVELLN